MYRSSALRSTLNKKVITGLGMCKVCTEAVRCIALWVKGWLFKRVPISSPTNPLSNRTGRFFHCSSHKSIPVTRKITSVEATLVERGLGLCDWLRNMVRDLRTAGGSAEKKRQKKPLV